MKPKLSFLLVIVVPIVCAAFGAVIHYSVSIEHDTRESGRYIGLFIGLITARGPMAKNYWEYVLHFRGVLFIYALALFITMYFAQYLVSCAFGEC